MRPFPKLMISTEPGECVVFFSNVTDGMCVHSEGSEHAAFGDIRSFDPTKFTDVGEEVVIWLTEGPRDRVYRAIEMLDKIDALDTGEEVV